MLDIAAAPTNCMARTAPTRRNFPEPPRFAATDPHLTPDDPFDARRPPVLTLIARGLHRRDLLPRSSPPPSFSRNIDIVSVTAITDHCLKSFPRSNCSEKQRHCAVSRGSPPRKSFNHSEARVDATEKSDHDVGRTDTVTRSRQNTHGKYTTGCVKPSVVTFASCPNASGRRKTNQLTLSGSHDPDERVTGRPLSKQNAGTVTCNGGEWRYTWRAFASSLGSTWN